MSILAFQRSEFLQELGIEHGFGTLHSGTAQVPGLFTARQVHGKTLVRVPCPTERPEADALWSDEPGIAVGVVTADCVPVLLVSVTRPAVAAIHAGWRGSAARIGEDVAKETNLKQTSQMCTFQTCPRT